MIIKRKMCCLDHSSARATQYSFSILVLFAHRVFHMRFLLFQDADCFSHQGLLKNMETTRWISHSHIYATDIRINEHIFIPAKTRFVWIHRARLESLFEFRDSTADRLDDLLIANELEECEYGQLLLVYKRHHLTVYFWYRWTSLYSANVLVFNPRLFKSFFFTSATFCSSPFSKWVMTDEWMIHTHSIEMNHPHHTTTYSISLFYLLEPGNLDYPSQNVLQQLMIIEQKAAFPQLCQCVSCLVCVCMLYVCLMIRVHWNDNFWQYAG